MATPDNALSTKEAAWFISSALLGGTIWAYGASHNNSEIMNNGIKIMGHAGIIYFSKNANLRIGSLVGTLGFLLSAENSVLNQVSNLGTLAATGYAAFKYMSSPNDQPRIFDVNIFRSPRNGTDSDPQAQSETPQR